MLEITGLTVSARGKTLLDHVFLRLERGQTVGLTGQSGAGKTTLLRAILGLLGPGCRIDSGDILIDGSELSRLSQKERRLLRGTTLGFIPQNPMTAFDSRITLGTQIAETLRLRIGLPRNEAVRQSRALLTELGLEKPERVLDSLPGSFQAGSSNGPRRHCFWR